MTAAGIGVDLDIADCGGQAVVLRTLTVSRLLLAGKDLGEVSGKPGLPGRLRQPVTLEVVEVSPGRSHRGGESQRRSRESDRFGDRVGDVGAERERRSTSAGIGGERRVALLHRTEDTRRPRRRPRS